LAERIALFFGNFHGGGVQRVRLVLAREFLSRGVQVDLVVVNGEGELRKAVPEQARIIDLQANRTLWALPALVRYLRVHKPQAILSSQTHHNLLAIIARKLSRISTLLVVGEHHNLHENRKDEGLPAIVHLAVAKVLYKYADEVLAVSEGVSQSINQALAIPLSSINTIHNPIDMSHLREKAHEQIDHSWLNQHQIPVIVGIGRLSKEKDFPTLIDAIEIITRSKKVRLVILGDGEDKNALMSMIKQKNLENVVRLTGYIDNPYAYLGRSSVFVLSSRREGFPNALLEALACGTAVVATDCPSGPSEMLENGKFGPLVPVGEPKALANAIIETLDNPLPAEILVNRAKDFSVDVIGDQYLELLLGSPIQKSP